LDLPRVLRPGEADEVCQRIAEISDGSIVATGTPADLKGRIPDRTIVEIEAFVPR
jgi:ABC-2 type transport system ATP-binding protein